MSFPGECFAIEFGYGGVSNTKGGFGGGAAIKWIGHGDLFTSANAFFDAEFILMKVTVVWVGVKPGGNVGAWLSIGIGR